MSRGVYSPEDAPSTQSVGDGSLASDVYQLMRDAQSLVGEHLNLLALEAQQAARALGKLAICGVAAGILLAATCLTFGAAWAAWLIEQGMRTSAALLLASLFYLFCVGILVRAMYKTSYALTFPATRTSLQSAVDIHTADKAP